MTERHDGIDAAEVRVMWDRAADAYAAGQASGRDYYRYEFFGPAQLDVCGDVTGRRPLDVGCGAGYFAREMATRGARVTGVDLSPRMLEHARQLEAATPLGIDYREMDAEAIDGAFAEPFDVVTSCLVLQDVPRPEAALRAMHAVLRPGGRAVLSMAHPCTDTPFREWLRDDAGRTRRSRSTGTSSARCCAPSGWVGVRLHDGGRARDAGGLVPLGPRRRLHPARLPRAAAHRGGGAGASGPGGRGAGAVLRDPGPGPVDAKRPRPPGKRPGA